LYLFNRMFLIIVLSLLSLNRLYGQPEKQLSVKSKHFEIKISPDDGVLALNVLKKNNQIFYSTEAAGLYFDNILQNNFEVVSENPLLLQNQYLKISFEILNERSIAVKYTPNDTGNYQFEFHLNSDDETEYYGMGERFNSVNQRGYILPNITDDRYGIKGVGTHKPIPFFMSSRGIGVWIDSYSPGTFDLNGSERFDTKINFTDSEFRIVFIGGEKLTETLSGFTELTGRPSIPPPWAFGLWKSRDVHHNQDSVYSDIEKLRKYKIPASVLVIDSPWETGYNNFEINTLQFSNHEKMFNRIEELGFNLCLWLTPFVNSENVIDMKGIHKDTDIFYEAAEKGYLVKDEKGDAALSNWWKGRGGLVDFTNPEAIHWWNQKMKRMLDYGVKAFKCDDGEGNFVPDAVFYDGTPAYKMKNRYSLLYDSVMQNFVNEYLDTNGVLINRSGYTGFQKYPFAWAGDNNADFSIDNGLPSVIIAAQNAALSGISLWGTDIAGYAGTPSKELFIRWTQFALFCPFMQIHMTSNLGPWDFGEETLEIFRKYAVLRLQLFPYLYNAVHQSADEGIPVIRPMALAFQNDKEAKKNIYQFMFGDDILVAPVYHQGNHRLVYIPDGNWIDYWNGKSISGRKYLEVNAPLDKIPLYIREGAIIPLLPDDVQTLVHKNSKMADSIKAIDDRIILQIWPGENGAVKTWDGIEAKLSKKENLFQLNFSSEAERPLTIEIMFGELKNIKADSREVSYNKVDNKTIISFDKFKGKYLLEWKRE
jgi:alpha-D-xyloside xylohydrolase